MPAFSLLIAPPAPHGLASQHTERSLTTLYKIYKILDFGYLFEPRYIFGALFLG